MPKTNARSARAHARRERLRFAPTIKVAKRSTGLFLESADGKVLKYHAETARKLHGVKDCRNPKENFKWSANVVNRFLCENLECLSKGMGQPHIVMCCPELPDSSCLKQKERSIIDVHMLQAKPEEGADASSMYGLRLLFKDKGVTVVAFLEAADLYRENLHSRVARDEDEPRRVDQECGAPPPPFMPPLPDAEVNWSLKDLLAATDWVMEEFLAAAEGYH